MDAGYAPVRPTELTDKEEPAGKYFAASETGMGALRKKYVGLFVCGEIDKSEWSGKPVQLCKAR